MKKAIKKLPEADLKARDLYIELTSQPKLDRLRFWVKDHCDQMDVLYEAIGEYWKPRFLIDHKNRQAREFMNHWEILQTVTLMDIHWESLRDLPDEVLMRAKGLSAHFPTRIGPFRKGRADVFWEINPDGRYYMDEDGFGMTDDVEITLRGAIDRRGLVVEKFHRE